MQVVANILLGVALIVLAAVVIIAALRFFTVRSKGTTVLLRKLPASGVHGWRHGVLLYDSEFVEFFKLRSLTPGRDLRFNRLNIAISEFREMTDREAAFISPSQRVLGITVGDVDFEIACNQHAFMAFNEWVEAAPCERHERPNYRRLKNRAQRPRSSNMPHDPSSWPSYYDR